MEQLTIWDILPEEKPEIEMSCFTCVFNVRGYIPNGKTDRHCKNCENLSSYIRVYETETDDRLIEWEPCESNLIYINGIPVTGVMAENWKTPCNIDRVEVGIYAGRDAEIGLRYCVSGPDDCFDCWVAVMWREVKRNDTV